MSQKVVCFTVGGLDYGTPIEAVKETIPLRPVTRVPLTPPLVAGLINLRGEVVAVLDLQSLLGLPGEKRDLANPDRKLDPDAAIVILRTPKGPGGRGGGRAACGLIVDRLIGARDVDPAAVKPPPSTVAQEAAGYLRGVAPLGDPPKPVALLDPEKVLSAERLKPFRRRA